MRDTPADIQARYRAMIQALSPEERLRMASGMFATAQTLVLAGARAGPAERRTRLFLAFYGREYPEAERQRILDALRASSA